MQRALVPVPEAETALGPVHCRSAPAESQWSAEPAPELALEHL